MEKKWGLTPFLSAFCAGAATVLAFAPVAFYPLALATFAILAHLWVRADQRACFWTGFAFGLGLFGVGASWVYVSLSRFGGMPAPLAGLATLCFCALLALFPALAGWLQARFPGSAAWRAVLLIPAAWVLLEWLRSWIFGGFPWLSAGYAAAGWPVQGLAAVVGVFGLSFLTLAVAGFLWTSYAGTMRWTSLASIIVLLAGAHLIGLVQWTQPANERFSAALLQGNIEQSLKFDPARYGRTLETYARLVEESTARLIVLPETALPRLHDQIDPAYYSRLASAARRNGGDLLLGVLYRASRDEYYNSVLAFGSAQPQLYHKRHLVPFGEFVPAGFGWVMRWLRIPFSDFSRGEALQPALTVAGQRVAVNICYEDAFGDEIASRAAGASVLVNVSNVAWFGDSLAPEQHLQIASLRAIETGRAHLTATNTGITAAIDRDGNVIGRLPQFAEGRLEVLVQGYAGVTPYVRLRDWPVLLACLGVLAAALFIARRKATR